MYTNNANVILHIHRPKKTVKQSSSQEAVQRTQSNDAVIGKKTWCLLRRKDVLSVPCRPPNVKRIDPLNITENVHGYRVTYIHSSSQLIYSLNK